MGNEADMEEAGMDVDVVADTEPVQVKMEVDEEMPVSSIQQQQQQQEVFSLDQLRVYYRRLFPFEEMHKWLSYGNDGKHPACDGSYFGRREFSFTLDHDIYVRYLSFRDAQEMEASICEKCPHKIDIGAVYNVDPAKRTAYSNLGGDRVFAPVERELVFDVDMTDYDDMRTCCSGADICLLCWPLMTIVIKVVDTALREDFGFTHMLWVYSGRRGVHCWVCDARARLLSNEQRAAVADYFRVYRGSENSGPKTVSLSGSSLHPALARAYNDVLYSAFKDAIVPNQHLLYPDDQGEKILQMVPDDSCRSQIRSRWQTGASRLCNSSEEKSKVRWEDFEGVLKLKRFEALNKCVQEVVFSHTYPRLDLEVSKHSNHLLKSPFCVHPKTGRVCVPIDPQECELFDPTTVPTTSVLLEELNNHPSSQAPGDRRPSREWEKTSMAKAVHFFRNSFLEPLIRSSKAELEEAYAEKLKLQASIPDYSW